MCFCYNLWYRGNFIASFLGLESIESVCLSKTLSIPGDLMGVKVFLGLIFLFLISYNNCQEFYLSTFLCLTCYNKAYSDLMLHDMLYAVT